ncbi:hypothetical protein ACSBR1_024956 [Camellia fascicularis]
MEVVANVVIVGAGIAGLATAVALKRVGIEALVLERSEGLRTTGAALTLFPNAWLALDALGIAQKLSSIYNPFKKACITNVANGAFQEVPMVGADRGEAGTRAVHRKALLEALAGELSTDTIRFNSKLTSIEAQNQEDSSIVLVRLQDGTEIKTKVLIGCDGVNSVVARWLGLGAAVNSGRSAVRGLAVYPQGHGFKHEMQQFIDVGKRGAFLPLNDKELYWFFISKSTYKGEEVDLIQREVLEKHAKNFPPAYLDVVGHGDPSTLTCAPLLLRYPWEILFGNVSKGTITVAGDAMHPMTPDLGQGGCSALEDAVALGRNIGESCIRNGKFVPGDANKAIDGYVKERRWRAAELITASYLSGWVLQQYGSGWWMQFIRDVIHYKFLSKKIKDVIRYDCGTLPKPSSCSTESEITNHTNA